MAKKFSGIFFSFSSNVSRWGYLIYFFFPSDKGKKTHVGACQPKDILSVGLGVGTIINITYAVDISRQQWASAEAICKQTERCWGVRVFEY